MQTLSQPTGNPTFQLPADGKIHCVAMGIFPVEYHGKTLVQVVDDRAIDAMVANFQQDALDPNFSGLCCDFEHFRHDPDKGSPAAAWIENVEKRVDGIYAMPRLTDGGRKAVEGGDYRGISPEFDPLTMQHLGGSRVRPTRLVGFGLTNAPNMKGMRPLTNRLAGAGGTVAVAASDAAHAALVRDLAGKLRAADKALSLHDSYRRAQAALDSTTNGASALVLTNRAKELRAADKTLSLAVAYRQARDGSPEIARTAVVSAIVGDMQARQAVLSNRASADAALHGSQEDADAVANLARELLAKNTRLSLASAYDAARRKLTIG